MKTIILFFTFLAGLCSPEIRTVTIAQRDDLARAQVTVQACRAGECSRPLTISGATSLSFEVGSRLVFSAVSRCGSDGYSGIITDEVRLIAYADGKECMATSVLIH